MEQVFVIVRLTKQGDGFDIIGVSRSYEDAQETVRSMVRMSNTALDMPTWQMGDFLIRATHLK